MEPIFNLKPEKISDEEIEKRKDFDALLRQLKSQKTSKWKRWKNKMPPFRQWGYTGIGIAAAVLFLICGKNVFKQFSPPNEMEPFAFDSKIASHFTPKTASVQKCIPDYETKEINNSTSFLIQHQEFTFRFNKGSFVSKEGESIHGTVTVRYRILQDKKDMLLAGVPFPKISQSEENLQAQCLVELSGQQNGVSVYLNNKAPISVQIPRSIRQRHVLLAELNTEGAWENMRAITNTSFPISSLGTFAILEGKTRPEKGKLPKHIVYNGSRLEQGRLFYWEKKQDALWEYTGTIQSLPDVYENGDDILWWKNDHLYRHATIEADNKEQMEINFPVDVLCFILEKQEEETQLNPEEKTAWIETPTV